MARKGENIFKRKDGRWEGRYIKLYENGRAVYGYVFGRSYSEAKRKKSEAMAGQSSFPKSVRTFSDQPFMREVAYQWLDGLKPIRRKSTVAKYEGQLRNHILPEFGDKRIDEISNNDIISFSQKLLEKGKKPRTVADIISRMRTIRKFSVLHGYSVKYISDCTEIPQTFEKAVLKKCGLQETKFHTLRHTFATRCVEVGFDVKTLSEILGHAGVHITLNRYVHPSVRTKHENMRKLNELL